MKTSHFILNERSIIVGSLICLALSMNACATFKKPAAINQTPVQGRALTKESNGIRVSAPSSVTEEARQIFGIDLLPARKFKPCGLEVENNTHRPGNVAANSPRS